MKKTKPENRFIHFTKKAGVDYDPEWYNIQVTAQPEVIHLTSGTEAGAFYGVQSVISLIEGGDGEIPVVVIDDKPRAAVLSMSHRSETNRQNIRNILGTQPRYNLVDDVAGGYGTWMQNTINPCLNSTYMFVNKILDELILLHRGVQDLRMIHIGGDEVKPGVWDSSPSCQRLTVANSPISTAQLKMTFVHTVANIAASKGLSIGAWEDGLYRDGPYPRLEFKNRDVYVYPWNNIWTQGIGGRAVEFADAGYKVILAPGTHLYLDHPYEPDPEERGLYWATRYTDTRRIFGFVVDDIFKNADVDLFGIPVKLAEVCDGVECPKTIRLENVIGLQACIWSETIRNERQLHYMAFPRLLAVAERAWHKPAWEDIESQDARDFAKGRDWKRFSHTLGSRELPRLERMGVHYRVPPPGAKVVDGFLIVNTQYTGHTIEAKIKGGQQWRTLDRPMALVSGVYTISLRSRSPVLGRPSRVITMEIRNEGT